MASSQRSVSRLLPAGLFLLCLFAFFWRLGSVPLFDLDEALYVTCARQMAKTGDIVTPRLNSRPLRDPGRTSVPFFEKPILVYWASAASLRLFGMSEGAARLPVACAALLATAVIAWTGSRLFGRRAGLLAGLVYATAPMTILDARQMTTDGLLVLWFMLVFLAFRQCYRIATSPDAADSLGSSIAPYAFWIASALAVLTKGAIGVVLPGLVFTVFLLLNRWRLGRTGELWRVVPALRPVAGILLFLAIVVPWHVAVFRAGGIDAQGRTWVQEYLIRQHVGRFRGGDTVHNMGILTYVPLFLLGFFPWSCFTPAAFRRVRSRPTDGGNSLAAADSCKTDSSTGPDAQQTDRGDHGSDAKAVIPEAVPNLDTAPDLGQEETRRYLLIWFWTIFVFFSISAAKLPTYIVPAYPAAALLVGRRLDLILGSREAADGLRSLRWGSLAAFITSVLLVIAAVVAPRFASASSPIPPAVQHLALAVTTTFAVGSLLAIACFAYRPDEQRFRRLGVGVLAATMLTFCGIAATVGYAVAARYVLDPYQQVAADARSDADAGIPVIFYHIIPRRPSMLFYAEYSPLEQKDEPLLPFLNACVSPAHPAADVITSRRTLREQLEPELAASGDVSWRILGANGSGTEGWILLQIARKY